MRYSLVGVNGNAFAIMGYTKRALMESGHKDLIEKMMGEAMSGDYMNLIRVCDGYIDIANGEEEDDWYEDLNDREFDIPYEDSWF